MPPPPFHGPEEAPRRPAKQPQLLTGTGSPCMRSAHLASVHELTESISRS